jgi:hypothetical protein
MIKHALAETMNVGTIQLGRLFESISDGVVTTIATIAPKNAEEAAVYPPV